MYLYGLYGYYSVSRFVEWNARTGKLYLNFGGCKRKGVKHEMHNQSYTWNNNYTTAIHSVPLEL